jgi:hypothetical protein
MDNLPLPSGPKNTVEVNPWTTGQKFAPLEARCGDAIVFTWTPSETHGVARLVNPPTKRNGTLSCACPAQGNGTVPEGLMLAPVTKGGTYRYIVINETEPFCVISQAQGDCKKGMQQIVKPSCPAAPAAAAAASAAKGVVAGAASLAAMVVAAVFAVVV